MWTYVGKFSSTRSVTLSNGLSFKGFKEEEGGEEGVV